MKIEITNTIDNSTNVNLAVLDRTLDITEDKIIQINDLSITNTDNLSPIYTDTITATSSSSGVISGINNVFMHEVKITDRYKFDLENRLTYPMWYEYRAPIAMSTKSYSDVVNRFNGIQINVAYKLAYDDNVNIVKNDYTVYQRRYSWSTWKELDAADYVINKAENTITILNSYWTGYNIRVVNKIVADPIILEYADGTIPDNYDIELKKVKTAPISGVTSTKSIDGYYYVRILLYSKPTQTLTVSFQTYSGYQSFIVNPNDIYELGRDFTIDSSYNIHTNSNNTFFYVRLPNRNSILNIAKDAIPQDTQWNIQVPRERVEIGSYTYYPKETNVMNYDSVVRVKESINQIDEDRIKLSYPNIYLVRGIDNKPVNMTIYSIMEDGEIINHDDIIDDIDVSNGILFVTKMEPINKVRTIVEYDIYTEKALIYHEDINPHKMFNKLVSLSDVVVYIIPEDEAKTNRTVFTHPIYPYYEYMDTIGEQYMSSTKAIEYITSGQVINDISEYVDGSVVHPYVLGIASIMLPVSANDVPFLDVRRLGTDIAYDYPIEIYEDIIYRNYTTVGWWWGRPVNLDNIAVVYVGRTTIDKLKTLYSTYDIYAIRNEDNTSFDLDNYIMEQVIKPKIKRHLRVGAKLVLEIVENE